MQIRWPREATVPVLFAAIGLAVLPHYGITWDEGVQALYGEVSLDYFLSGFSGDRSEGILDLRFYGPLFEMLPAALYRNAPQWKYEIRHLLVALTGLLAIIAVGRLARRADADPLLAQLTLVCLPQFWGHAFNNSKDIPFACAVAWTLLAFARLAERPSWRRAGIAGVCAGLALSVRAGGILVFAIAAATVFATASRKRDMLARLAAAGAIAWVLMIAFWPWAHHDPIGNPLRALREATSFSRQYEVLFEGHSVMSDQLPRRYLVEMLAITTPLPALLLAAAGIVVAMRKERRTIDWLLCATVVVPVVLFVLLRPHVYDGIRHFLFLLPPMAVCAAIAARDVARRWPSLAVRAALVAVIAFPANAMLRLHPYEMTYYNALVGGTRGAVRRFETDYWVTSYREAALWVRDHPCPGRPTRALVAANSYSVEAFAHYLPRQGFVIARTAVRNVPGTLPEPFDYYVGTTRYRLAANYPMTPVTWVVERDGAAFAIVRGACR